MSKVVIEGYSGGKLLLDDRQQVTAFFDGRFMTGGSCDVFLGPVVDQLLALKPDKHLAQRIAGIDAIYATQGAQHPGKRKRDVILNVVSSYRHCTDHLKVSQDKLRQAVRWARIAHEAKQTTSLEHS